MDKFIVGLIVVALLLPVKWFIETTFDMSNDEGTQDLWLVWPLRQAIKFRMVGFKKHSWHWADPKTRPSWFVRHNNTHNGDWNTFEVALALWERAHAGLQMGDAAEIDAAMLKAERAAGRALVARGVLCCARCFFSCVATVLLFHQRCSSLAS